MDEEPFRFDGFALPTYTQVPDEVFDVLMPALSGAEFKVLLYIVRRTFGFRKLSDEISLQQIITGIKTKEGRWLDRGTGLSRDSVTKAIKSLEEKGVIVRNRRYSEEKGDQPSTYGLRFRGESENLTRGGRISPPPPVRESDPQETVEQQTDEQDDSSSRKPTPLYDKERDTIRAILEDVARELGDEASLAATVSRALAMYRESGLDLDTFCDRLYQARAVTKERSAAIQKKRSGDNPWSSKNKMPYMFSVLSDLLGRQTD